MPILLGLILQRLGAGIDGAPEGYSGCGAPVVPDYLDRPLEGDCREGGSMGIGDGGRDQIQG